MKICFVCKYPPIEGGVSSTTYWLGRALAERGHQVYIVTNSAEVEATYRMSLADDDAEWLTPTFPSGGSIQLCQVERFNTQRMDHIPHGNPFVSKLAARATEVIRRFGCDLIFAYYFEPYAVAGYLASIWTNRPLLLKHAGSDLDRLMKGSGLAATYREILRSAAGVVTRPGLVDRFLAVGVSFDRIFPDFPFSPPQAAFNPAAEPLIGIPRALDGEHPFDPTLPTIGIYGKVGFFKGSFDLVEALGILKAEGLDFNFVAVTQGHGSEEFAAAVARVGITDRTWLLPFVPPWKVPRFIRTCTAVCFLERDFPIKIHGPIVPREVLSCGTCLVLSHEIAHKQVYARQLADQDNVLLVEDPKDHLGLARVLRLVVENPEEARAIGSRGHRLALDFPDFAQTAQGMEQLLARIVGCESKAKSYFDIAAADPAMTAVADHGPIAVTIAHQLAWARFFLGERFAPLLACFCQRSPQTNGRRHAFRLAIELCDELTREVDTAALPGGTELWSDLVRFAKARLFVNSEDPADLRPVFDEVDVLAGERVKPESIGKLRPLQGNYVRIERFDRDVTPFFSASITWRSKGLSPEEVVATKLGAVIEQGLWIYFYRLPNLSPGELRINSTTKELLHLADGQHTTDAICSAFAARQGLQSEAERNELTTQLVATLGQLYRKGAVVFV